MVQSYTDSHATHYYFSTTIFFTVQSLPRAPLRLYSLTHMRTFIYIYSEIDYFLFISHDISLSLSDNLFKISCAHFIKHLIYTSRFSWFFQKMSTKAFEYAGAKFVTNNYAAILSNAEAPNEFHLIQDYLAHSEFMYALTQPEVISPSQVLSLWRSARYNDGGEHGSPSLTCTYEG